MPLDQHTEGRFVLHPLTAVGMVMIPEDMQSWNPA
jgi:hypothetical protein